MYCPKCGSDRINFLPWLGMMYECPDCRYRGPLALGKIEKLDENAMNALKNKEKRKK